MKLILQFLCLLSLMLGVLSELEITRRPTPSPYPDICSYNKDLFDDQKYLKSACFMEQKSTQRDAKHACKILGMDLFIMRDEIEASHLMDAAQEKYRSAFPGGKDLIWVNGNRASLSKRWQITDVEGSTIDRLNPNIPFYSNHESGNCLSLSPKYTKIYGVLPGNCMIKSFFVCEHQIRSQSPPKPDLSQCLYVRDVRRNKTLCVIGKNYDYDQARRACASNGMNLFMIDSAEIDEAFFEATEDFFLHYPRSSFWVNGQRNPQTNEWFVYRSNRVLQSPLYKEFEWIKLWNINGVSNGNCLRLTSQFGPYQGLGDVCDMAGYPICEFNGRL
ncbi:hypothetical protein ACKWTF_015586 [Chironomus riparius]